MVLKSWGLNTYQCSFHLRGAYVLVLSIRCNFWEAEVGDFGNVRFAKQDVAGLDVTVDDWWVGRLMQVC